jgi:EmrB/QacA subfamily drug resistance transporter
MFSKRLTLGVVCAATAMLMLDIAVVNTALPHIARSLHAGLSSVQWVVDAYTLALAVAVLTAGSLNDRFGRKVSLMLGLTLFTISSTACALARSIAALDVSRAFQGVGAAIMFAATLAVLADAFPDQRERAGAFAAYGASIGGAFAVGPLVGGALTSGFGWRAIFFVNVPLGIGCLVAAAIGVRESRDPHPRRVDAVGLALLTGGLFLLVLALIRGNTEGWSTTAIVVELITAGALLTGFLVVEQRRRDPMMPLGLFANPSFAGAQIAAFAISASFFAVFFYTTLYLQVVLHLSPIEAGLAYLPMSVIVFVVSGASAQLSSRVSHRTMIVAGLTLVAAGMATCTIAGVTSSWTAILPGFVLAGVGTGLFNPAVSSLAIGQVAPHQSGLGAGVNDTFRYVGIAVGVAALGALIPAESAFGGGSAAIFVVGFHRALLVSAVVAAAGALASAALIKVRRPSVLEAEAAEAALTAPA